MFFSSTTAAALVTAASSASAHTYAPLAASSLSKGAMDLVLDTAATSPHSVQYASFSHGPPGTAESFVSSLEAQWGANALNGTETAPYVICDSTPSKSGRDRATLLRQKCGIDDAAVAPLLNHPETACFRATLTPPRATGCAAQPAVTVTPFTAWTKVPGRAIADSFGSSADGVGGERRYAALFCPAESAPARQLAARAVGALHATWKNKDNGCPPVPFGEAYRTRRLEGRGLLLHPVDRSPSAVMPDGCVLALIGSLGSHPFVCDVEHDVSIRVLNDQARWIIQGSVGKASTELPLHAAGLLGQGQVAQVSDTGLSVNSCYFYDKTGEVQRDKSKTVDLTRRKVVQYYAKYNAVDGSAHGTHCAGTIAGSACPYPTGCNSPDNKDGNAPAAKIAVYDMDSDSGYLYPDPPAAMFRTGIQAGAHVHSASWGSFGNGYKSTGRDWDAFQHNNPEYLVVAAAGNYGWWNAEESVIHCGKNTLVVCASLSAGTGLGEKYVADFSSMGMCSDGRMKPDICAPGKYIGSAAGGTTKRQCNFNSYQGTSMACPGVAGAALLVRQYFTDGYYPTGSSVPTHGFTPTGYLIRAVILNSGRLMLGRDNLYQGVTPSTMYDAHQGFGLISLIDGIYLPGHSASQVLVFDRVVLRDGDAPWERILALDRKCGAPHVSVTLDYFDKENASTSCRRCTVNRVDLTVVSAGGTVHYPNGRQSPEARNTSQRVRLDRAAAGGRVVVRVAADSLITNKQEFAVVASGCLVDVTDTEPHPEENGGTEGVLRTPPGRGVVGRGNMFDLVARRPLRLVGLDVHVYTPNDDYETAVDVYVKPGSWTEAPWDASKWTHLGSHALSVSAGDNYTAVGGDTANWLGLDVRAGETYGVYLHNGASTAGLISSSPAGTSVGDVHMENDHVAVLTGAAAAGDAFGSQEQPFRWEGALRYRLLARNASPAPTGRPPPVDGPALKACLHLSDAVYKKTRKKTQTQHGRKKYACDALPDDRAWRTCLATATKTRKRLLAAAARTARMSERICQKLHGAAMETTSASTSREDCVAAAQEAYDTNKTQIRNAMAEQDAKCRALHGKEARVSCLAKVGALGIQWEADGKNKLGVAKNECSRLYLPAAALS